MRELLPSTRAMVLWFVLSGSFTPAEPCKAAETGALASTSMDGLYAGTEVPDSIQDNTRARCGTGTVRRQIFISDGLAYIIYRTGPGYGLVSSEGRIELTTSRSQITLVGSTDGLSGRILVGNGPWCKYSLSLHKIVEPVKPLKRSSVYDRVIDFAVNQNAANPPGKCDNSSYSRRLWIHGGIAMMWWGDGGTYGYVSDDGHIDLRGEARVVHLETINGSYSGEAFKGPCRVNLKMSGIVF